MIILRNPSDLRNDFSGWLIVAFASALWGCDVVLRPRVLAAGLDSVLVVLLEHAILSLIFLPIVFKARHDLVRMNRKEFAATLFISWAGSMLATVLLTQAYVAGDALTATLLQKFQPAFAILLAGPILKERRAKRFWLWFGIALAGAYLLSFGFTWIGDPFNHKGLIAAGYAVAAAALWGTCTVVGRWSLAHMNPLPLAGLRFILAMPVLIAWAIVGQHFGHIQGLASRAIFTPLILIVIFPDALGMGLYYVGLQKTTASLATLAELAYPATAVLLALGTAASFSSMQWLGILLLLASLYLIRKENLVAVTATD